MLEEDSVTTTSFPFYQGLLFLFILIVSIAIGNICYSLIRRTLDGRISRSNSKLLANLVQYMIIFLGIYYGVRNILHFNLGELGASLGILTIIIAFSSKEIIQNILSGALIILNRPIRLEDWIVVGGFPTTGVSKVVDIALMNTILREIDGRLIILPNSFLLTQKIINYTRSGLSMVQIPLHVSNSIDLNLLRN
ncbi:MAG: mechanosensitive ion channel, partial [Methanomicrobiaceae archaeon]|nr:mechanosensitive ion channel [Methanomicrobiaceae archaeon]